MATGQLGLEATIVGPTGPAGPATIIVSEGGVTVDTDITTVDFDASDFTLVESPENTVGISLAYGTSAGTPAEGNHTHSAIYQPLDSDLTTIAALADPNADRVLFWDDSAGAYAYLTAGTNLTITGTTIDATGGGGGITTEDAQDAIGTILTDSASIDFTYDDATPTITATAIFGSTATTVAAGNHTHTGVYAPLASPTFTGTVTLPTGLTGVIRADTGVVSVDTDVTDIVAAASTTVAGKVELATDAETNTGTDTARAITPSNLEAWTGSAFITTVGTLASPTLTTPTIAATGFTNMNHTHVGATTGGTIAHTALTSIGTNTHAQIDTHLASTANPHSVTAAQVGAVPLGTDPNADRIYFWDDSAGASAFLTMGTNLTITGTTLDATGGGGGITVEDAQDAVGTILVDSASIDFTYSDATPSITATAIFGTSSTTIAAGDHTHATLYQPLDDQLTDFAGLAQAANTLPYFDSTTTMATTSLTSAGRALIDDADAAAQLVTLGLTATAAEINYTDGVTSAIQPQMDLKAPKASPIFTGTVTLPVALTGVVRADAGVVSVDTDVTDIVAAASTTVAGKVELATDAETNTGTDTARAITPSNLEAWTGSAFITTVGTLASPVLTTPTIASFINATHTHADAATGGTLSGYSTTSHTHTITDSWKIPVGDGVNVISTGIYTDWQAPFAGTLIAWRILGTKFSSGSTGSIVFDVWADTFANFPPVVGDSISTSKPTLTTAASTEDTTITDWTEAFAAGTVFRLNVDSCSLLTLCTLILEYTRAV